jgi:membrane protease YdiL (CAAX protease family)
MDRLSDFKDKYNDLELKHPYAVSVGEAAVAFLVKKGVKKIGERAGLKLQHGRADNPTRNKVIEEHPVAAAALATVAAPIGEEILYRHLTAKGLDHLDIERDTTKRTAAELGVTALFSAQHAGRDGLPIPQLIGGLVYQRAYNRRGLKGSITSHITNNALAVGEAVYRKRKQN